MCFSSTGSCWVTPNAMPMGRMVTLWTGSALGSTAAQTACPASWYAMTSFSASDSAMESRRWPMSTRSRACSKSVSRISSDPSRTANSAASLTRLARSAPLMPAEPGAALAADRVDLVDEDDRPAQLASVLEQVAHPAGADADEHLHEVGTGDREEGHPGLARHGPGDERLAGAGGADEQHALGDAGPDLREPLGVLEEVDDLADLLLHAVVAGHVGERGARALGAVRLGAAAPDRHDAAHLALGPALHQPEDADEQRHRDEQRQQRLDPRTPGARELELHVVLAEQRAVVLGRLERAVGRELGAVVELAGDRPVVVVPGDLADLVLLDPGQHLGVLDLVAVGVRHEARTQEQEGEHDAAEDPDRPAWQGVTTTQARSARRAPRRGGRRRGRRGLLAHGSQDTGDTSPACHRPPRPSGWRCTLRAEGRASFARHAPRLLSPGLRRDRHRHAHLRLPGEDNMAGFVGVGDAPDVLRPVRRPRRHADGAPGLAARRPPPEGAPGAVRRLARVVARDGARPVTPYPGAVHEPDQTVTAPAAPDQVRWGLGDAVVGWVLGLVGGALVGGLVLAATGADDFDDVSIGWGGGP